MPRRFGFLPAARCRRLAYSSKFVSALLAGLLLLAWPASAQQRPTASLAGLSQQQDLLREIRTAMAQRELQVMAEKVAAAEKITGPPEFVQAVERLALLADYL